MPTVIGLDGRGVIKTWTVVAARVRLYVLTSDLTSSVASQFSYWLQVRKVVTVFLSFFLSFFNSVKLVEIITEESTTIL